MAENVTIARPYADAAFQLARGAGTLEPWSEALERMAAIAADADMRAVIANPQLSASKVAKLFLDVVGGSPDAVQQNFVHILADNERLAVLPQIRELFLELKREFEGVQKAQITSAFPIDDAMLRKLVADLEGRFNARIEASVSIDPELIGGVRIAVGDQVIDASVRGKLAAMAAALKN